MIFIVRLEQKWFETFWIWHWYNINVTFLLPKEFSYERKQKSQRNGKSSIFTVPIIELLISISFSSQHTFTQGTRVWEWLAMFFQNPCVKMFHYNSSKSKTPWKIYLLLHVPHFSLSMCMYGGVIRWPLFWKKNTLNFSLSYFGFFKTFSPTSNHNTTTTKI